MILRQQIPVPDQFYYHAIHGHFHFPLASFGLYSVKADGSLGQPVALSPKNGFCIADTQRRSTRASPAGTATPAPPAATPPPCGASLRVVATSTTSSTRARPSTSPGLADGVYWFHTVADPNQNFIDANRANNTTDIKVKIVGTTVTPLSSLVSQGNFVIDQSAVVDGQGPQSTPPMTTAAPDELLVATVSSDGPAGTPQTATVSGGGLNWTLARRTNSQAGTAEVWTAMAATPLTNAVITSTTSPGRLRPVAHRPRDQGSGRHRGQRRRPAAASGAATASLTTTAPGSWVMGVGVDPNHYIQRTLDPGQSMVHEWLAENQGNSTSWVQATPAPTRDQRHPGHVRLVATRRATRGTSPSSRSSRPSRPTSPRR